MILLFSWTPVVGAIAFIAVIALVWYILYIWLDYHKDTLNIPDKSKYLVSEEEIARLRNIRLAKEQETRRVQQKASALEQERRKSQEKFKSFIPKKSNPTPVDWDKLERDKKRGGYESTNPNVGWEDDAPSFPHTWGDTSSHTDTPSHSSGFDYGGGDFGGGGSGSSYGDSGSSSGDSGGGDSGGGGDGGGGGGGD